MMLHNIVMFDIAGCYSVTHPSAWGELKDVAPAAREPSPYPAKATGLCYDVVVGEAERQHFTYTAAEETAGK
jgi:hypothetical protein